MDYKIGDKVVYPNHGVGVVEQISYGVLNGRTERYFMIRIVSSGLQRYDRWPSFRYSFHGIHQSPWFPRKGQTQLSSRLEAPLQRELRAHAHRGPSRSRRGPQESRFPQPQQASLLSRKENAGTRKVPPRQRNGHFPQHHGGKRRSHCRKVSRQGQTTVSHHDREIRIVSGAAFAVLLLAGNLALPATFLPITRPGRDPAEWTRQCTPTGLRRIAGFRKEK